MRHHPTDPMNAPQPIPRLLLPAFFLSGFAALTYEMSWLRQLVSLFGVTYFAITTILTVFMGGIALGSVIAGRLVDRWRTPPLLIFVALELFLAIYAQIFPHVLDLVETVYLSVASAEDTSFTTHAVLRFIFGALVLLPPTLVAGATLPAASKAFATVNESIGRDIARLYGANVIGAAAGCLATTFFTIGLLGYPATAWIGTGANLLAALLAYVAYRKLTPVTVDVQKPEPSAGAWRPAAVIVGASYFVVGFCVLGIEVLWTRSFSQFGFNPATYVFGLILVTFLIGHSLGAGLGFRRLSARFPPEKLFTGLIATIGICGLISVLLMIPRPGSMHPVGFLRTIGIVLPHERVWLLIPAILLPAACSGALFPLASRLAIRDRESVGRGVGVLAALSTIGGIAGSFLTGFFLMPSLGAVNCLIAFAGLAGLAAVWSGWALGPSAPKRRSIQMSIAVVVMTATCIFMIPSYVHLLLFPGEEMVLFTEGRNSSTAVVDHPTAGRFMLVNGERLQGGGSNVHLAMALHPEATRAAVIGVGTGRVTAGALSHPQLEQVWAIDIDGDLPKLMPLMLGDDFQLFKSDRFKFVENDGRHFLLTWPGTFDIVVNDAAIYAWYLELSTQEFNTLVKERLAPEGLYIGRLHLWRITDSAFRREIATFLSVFENAAFWRLSEDIGMLVGRNGDLPVDTEVTLPLPPILQPTLWYNREQLAEIAAGQRVITDDHPLHVPHTFLTRDLYPIIEYTSPEQLPTPPPQPAQPQ